MRTLRLPKNLQQLSSIEINQVDIDLVFTDLGLGKIDEIGENQLLRSTATQKEAHVLFLVSTIKINQLNGSSINRVYFSGGTQNL